MDMLRCFLTSNEDLRHLFKGLHIESSPVWSKANSASVFYFDFKGLRPKAYKSQIISQFNAHVYSLTDPSALKGYLKHQYEEVVNNQERVVDSLKILTEIAYGLTGKRSYLLYR